MGSVKMASFKAGDIVQLKSGGPAMTVSKVGADGDVWCNWFRGAQKESAAFKPDTLQAYVAPKVAK